MLQYVTNVCLHNNKVLVQFVHLLTYSIRFTLCIVCTDVCSANIHTSTMWYVCIYSSGCSTETRDDSAHFQETTDSLSFPHLMCCQTEGTFNPARHCCGLFMILAPDIKLQTYLLTFYAKTYSRGHCLYCYQHGHTAGKCGKSRNLKVTREK